MAQKAKSSYHLKQLQGKVPFRYDKGSHSWARGAYKNYPAHVRDPIQAARECSVPPRESTQRFTERHKLHPCARTLGVVPDGQKAFLPECYSDSDK